MNGNLNGTVKSYEDLMNAVIIRAVADLRVACMKLKINKYNQDARIELDDLMMFFYSDWFSFLTNVDPDYIVSRVKEEVKNWDPKDKSTKPHLSMSTTKKIFK